MEPVHRRCKQSDRRGGCRMTKEQFLTQLKRSISGLKEAEKKEILYDYEEHFRMGLENKKTEEEIAESLGNPKVLGKSFKIDAFLGESKEGSRAVSVLRAVLTSLSLGFLSAVFILGPFTALVSVFISFWAAAGALALSGVAAIFILILQPLLPDVISFGGQNIAFVIFSSIGVSAIGLMAIIGMVRLSKWIFLVVEKYIRFNLRIIKK